MAGEREKECHRRSSAGWCMVIEVPTQTIGYGYDDGNKDSIN